MVYKCNYKCKYLVIVMSFGIIPYPSLIDLMCRANYTLYYVKY